MQNRAIMPTLWLLIVLFLMLILHFALPLRTLVALPWSLSGLLPLALGIAINLIADGAFHQAHTTVKPFRESSALITEGVFAFTRNPMYLGFIAVLTGAALLLGTITPWLVILPFAVLMDRGYIAVEEQMLADKFGPAWDAYRSRVRRWL
ncbi:MAG: isoprenylcysteine carboxylmethyltransferase family protein [Anaerolineae bacterium]|jgi:protein-S-isoprenylcysteine O-methyltransferase Ste14|nr:isoprenylcysteine carboxylmethyltransferase family protein [Anaerolineae bacterium]